MTLFHRTVEGHFDDGRTLREEEVLRSEVLAGLELPVRDLLIED